MPAPIDPIVHERFAARRRRFSVVLLLALALIGYAVYGEVTGPGGWLPHSEQDETSATQSPPENTSGLARASNELQLLEVKGRAPKTGYKRTLFGNGWEDVGYCDVRNLILRRDLLDTVVDEETGCLVLEGTLHDPYTDKLIQFTRGPDTSQDVQIDHVVALSDAWQKGAQQLTEAERAALANDPLNLLAVDGPTNVRKGDGDAATWLPPNRAYRCAYVARQIAVKRKYRLWVTKAEKQAMERQLKTCPNQLLPKVSK